MQMLRNIVHVNWQQYAIFRRENITLYTLMAKRHYITTPLHVGSLRYMTHQWTAFNNMCQFLVSIEACRYFR